MWSGLDILEENLKICLECSHSELGQTARRLPDWLGGYFSCEKQIRFSVTINL